MPKEITGVLPIVHTPFDDNDSIDNASLEREIDWAFQSGADGICTGMVSEILRLTAEERINLTPRLVELAAGRGVVIASVGSESRKQACHFACEAERAGCDGVMAIPPISTALPDSETRSYFEAIADSIALPVIVQDASAYVGKEISLDVCAELLDRYGPDKIMFKPEAAPIGPNLSALRDRTNGRARIFEGSGGISLIDSFRRGISGTMPGMELLKGIVALWNALKRGDDEEAYRIYFPICAMVALQMQAGLDGFLAIEKYILVKRGIFTTANRRRPYSWELDDETTSEVDRLLAIIDASVESSDG